MSTTETNIQYLNNNKLIETSMLLKYIYYMLMMSKIDKYIFFEISKGCLFTLFIFLSISWLLQFTRLVSLTNLIQVDIFTIFYLSIFLIPNFFNT